MGSVYNRGSPERPNIWVKYRDVDGKWKAKGIGHVNPTGKTKAQIRAEERQLRKIGAATLAQIQLNVYAGNQGLPNSTPKGIGHAKLEDVMVPWAENRKLYIRSGKKDFGWVQNHILPFFGKMRIAEIGVKEIKAFIDTMRGRYARNSIINSLNLISRFYNDKIEEGEELVNPVAKLDRATRRSIGPKYDPRKTPYLETKQEIRRVYLALPPLPSPLRPMFATGAFGGLRTGEIIALERRDVKVNRRRVHVQRSVQGPVKNHQSRMVPLNDTLLPILREWMLCQGGGSVLFPPPFETRGGRPGSPPKYVREHTLGKQLRKALREAEVDDGLTWYQATRHTFASHWVMDGGSIRKLCEILGHASVTTTERYAHLAPDSFDRRDYETATVDLNEGADVVEVDFRKGSPEGFVNDDLGTDQVTLSDSTRRKVP